MYESGDGQAAERVLTSGSISELLTQAEYAEKVHSYDRDQLEEYEATVQEVEKSAEHTGNRDGESAKPGE